MCVGVQTFKCLAKWLPKSAETHMQTVSARYLGALYSYNTHQTVINQYILFVRYITKRNNSFHKIHETHRCYKHKTLIRTTLSTHSVCEIWSTNNANVSPVCDPGLPQNQF